MKKFFYLAHPFLFHLPDFFHPHLFHLNNVFEVNSIMIWFKLTFFNVSPENGFVFFTISENIFAFSDTFVKVIGFLLCGLFLLSTISIYLVLRK